MKLKEATSALWNVVRPLGYALAGIGPLDYLHAQLQGLRPLLLFVGVATSISAQATTVHKRCTDYAALFSMEQYGDVVGRA